MSSPPITLDQRRALRRSMRARRRMLTRSEQRLAARRLCSRVTRLICSRPYDCIAGYVAMQGEMDIAAVLDAASRSGRQVFLPIVDERRGVLRFARLHGATRLVRNRFGIVEPDPRGARLIDPRRLDLVLTPLVAFDGQGNRIGMGGGYYDRTFAFLGGAPRLGNPRLLGVGYEFQRVAEIVAAPWDIGLWRVATDSSLHPCTPGFAERGVE